MNKLVVIITLAFLLTDLGFANDNQSLDKKDFDSCVKQLKNFDLLLSDQSDAYTKVKLRRFINEAKLEHKELIALVTKASKYDEIKKMDRNLMHLAIRNKVNEDSVSNIMQCKDALKGKEEFKSLLYNRIDRSFEIARGLLSTN